MPHFDLLFSCCVFLMFPYFMTCSSSEPDVEATLDKMFDELAFKQNDSKWTFDVIMQLVCNKV